MKRKNITILVVDDDRELCALCKEELEDEGFKVIIAYNGADAFSIYQAQEVDVILSDIKMPNGDGLKLIQKIKAQGQNTPLMVLMTGFAAIDDDDVYDMGVTKLYVKPLDVEEFVEDIIRFLSERKTKKKTV